MKIRLLAVIVVLAGVNAVATAQVAGKAAREAAEKVFQKFGKEAAELGLEETRFALRLEKLAAEHGEQAYLAAEKAGPKAVTLAEQAGKDADVVLALSTKHGDQAVRVLSEARPAALIAKYGQEAGEALIRHGGAAEDLIEKYGQDAVQAIKGLGTQEARQLAMMSQSGDLAAAGRPKDLLKVVGQYGDRGMQFIWKHKGALAVAAILASFLSDPQPYIDGVKELASNVVDSAGSHLVEPITKNTNWTWIITLVILLLAAGMGLAYLLRHRRELRTEGKQHGR